MIKPEKPNGDGAGWAEGAGSLIQKPSQETIAKGWLEKFAPPAGWFNWWQNVVGVWVKWLELMSDWLGSEQARLQTELDNEEQARADGDAKLATDIAKEATDRADEDEAINDRIDSLVPLIGLPDSPVGTILPYYGNTATLGANSDWLFCDNSPFDTTKYKPLLDHLTACGKANPTITPDMAGRVLAGVGMMASGVKALGETGGSHTSVLNASNIPAHSHTIYAESTENNGSDKVRSAHDGNNDNCEFSTSSWGEENPSAFGIDQSYLSVNFIIRAR